MLLFFDGIALLAPPKAIDSLVDDDQAVARALVDANLLHLLNPTALIDDEAADRIMTFLTQTSASLQARAQYQFQKPLEGRRKPALLDLLMRSSLEGDVLKYAEDIWHELFCRGVAADARASYPRLLHPNIWATVESLLAYTLRPAGFNVGLELHPITEDSNFLDNTMNLLGRSSKMESFQFLTSNLEEVAPDFSGVPLERVLEFREAHGQQYRCYMQHLYSLMIDFLEGADHEEPNFLADRYAGLAETAEDLRRIIRQWWRCPVVTMGVAIVGARWKATYRDDLPAVLSLFNGNVGTPGSERHPQGAYSYLLKGRWSLLP